MHTGRQALRQVHHALGTAGEAGAQQIAAIEIDRAARRHQPGHRLEQGRLAAAVGAEQCCHSPRQQGRHRQLLDDRPLAIADIQAFYLQTLHQRTPLPRNTMVRKNGMPTSAVTIPTGINTPGTMFFDATDASDRISAPANALPGR
jgi:hypothetical protein